MEQARGITLFEILLTLSVLSALAAISMPNFQSLAQSISGEITLRRLANAVQLGKSSAITQGTVITLCPLSDGPECGRDWHAGIRIFGDVNGNRRVDPQENTIRQILFPDSNGRIRFRAFQNKQYLQITSLGITRNQNGNFTYCPISGERSLARQLILNRTARLRFAQDSDGDGIREDSRGRPLDCD